VVVDSRVWIVTDLSHGGNLPDLPLSQVRSAVADTRERHCHAADPGDLTKTTPSGSRHVNCVGLVETDAVDELQCHAIGFLIAGGARG